jgi:hypothetical protein
MKSQLVNIRNQVVKNTQNTMLLKIKYRYFGLDYLVCGIDNNLYLIPHFRYRRTVYFKKLIPFKNGNKSAIKYHGSNISFNILRKLKIKVDEVINVY